MVLGIDVKRRRFKIREYRRRKFLELYEKIASGSPSKNPYRIIAEQECVSVRLVYAVLSGER